MAVEVPIADTMYPARNQAKKYMGHYIMVNERWFSEGTITDNDPYPWLRMAQLEGEEICVIGCTPNAVRVAIEAWQAGFKPVLIICEDQISEKDEMKLRGQLSVIKNYRIQVGKVITGPSVILTSAADCHATLDSNGYITNVFAQGRSTVHHMSSEKWTLFHGPAIVVDSFVCKDNMGFGQDSHPREGEIVPLEKRKELHMSRVAKERDTICDPKFWDDRYDPNTLGFFVFPYSKVGPNILLGALEVACIVWVQKLGPMYEFLNVFWFLDVCADLAMEGNAMLGLSQMIYRTLGVETRTLSIPTVNATLNHVFGRCILTVCFIKSTTYFPSDFLDSGFAMNGSTVFLTVWAKFITKCHITRYTLMWVSAVLQGTVGIWIQCVAMVMLYQIILEFNEGVASVFLSFGFTAIEAGQVKFNALAYDMFVAKPRRKNPNNLVGDQKKAVAQSTAYTHAFVECGRLMALIIGACTSNSPEYLQSVLLSLLINLFMNTLSRSGWQAHLVSKVAKTLRLNFIHNLICPGGVGAMHQTMKYACGHVRFAVLAGVFLGRGLIHMDWETPMTVQTGRPTCWCFSGVVLLTALMSFAFEVLEDVVANYFNTNHCPPHWTRFQDVIMKKLGNPVMSNIMHMTHLVIPASVVKTPSPDEVGKVAVDTQALQEGMEKEQKRRSQSSRHSKAGKEGIPQIFKQDATRVCYAPNFKMGFKSGFVDTNMLVGPSGLVCIAMLAVGLGNGFLFGFCDRIASNETPIKVRNMVIWNKQCEGSSMP